MKVLLNNRVLGHFIAFITIFIWSLTFVQTKVLLEYLSPIEILIERFFLAWILFFIFVPKIVFYRLKDELLFIALGFSGIFAYYILENLALKYGNAINVGVIVTTAPIFTTLFLIFIKKYKKREIFFTLVGFIFVIFGLFIINFNNLTKINIGDFLALLGALFFGIYSLILSKVSKEYNIFIVTRKSFFWGLIFFFLYFYFFKEHFALFSNYKQIEVWSNLLFLALVASGLCFVMWRYSVSTIGSSKTSNYIYLVPVINTLASIYFLNEEFSLNIAFAIVLILSGLFISQRSGV
jgi:drug/metabolite transporter (DMT)-like permease